MYQGLRNVTIVKHACKRTPVYRNLLLLRNFCHGCHLVYNQHFWTLTVVWKHEDRNGSLLQGFIQLNNKFEILLTNYCWLLCLEFQPINDGTIPGHLEENNTSMGYFPMTSVQPETNGMDNLRVIKLNFCTFVNYDLDNTNWLILFSFWTDATLIFFSPLLWR